MWRSSTYAEHGDSFGTETPNQNPSAQGSFTFNLRFPGQYYDAETGLHYNYFRDYSPSLGRYIEPDPIGLKGGVNLYGYASQGPLDSSDLFGLKDKPPLCCGGSCKPEMCGGPNGVPVPCPGPGPAPTPRDIDWLVEKYCEDQTNVVANYACQKCANFVCRIGKPHCCQKVYMGCILKANGNQLEMGLCDVSRVACMGGLGGAFK
jgi:RHS repeat-associated protein